MRGRTRCETHGGKGAPSRNYAQQARNQQRACRELQWQLDLQIRQFEKVIRKLKRSGASTEIIEDVAKQRRELLVLAGQDGAELSTRPDETCHVRELGEPPVPDDPHREIGPDHPLRHLNRDRARGAMLGLAVGEAVGITLVAQRRGSFREIAHLRGGGLLGLKPGQWAGDTAMALALMDNLACRRAFDEVDFMERLIDWRDKGEYSCTGVCVGMDASIAEALARFEVSRNGACAGTSNSNGSLARIAPVAIRHWKQSAERHDVAVRQSLATHGGTNVSMACLGFVDLLAEAIADRPKSEVLARRSIDHELSHRPLSIGGWERLDREDISGADDALSSLYAAIWCVGTSYTFRDAVLAAANLGEDAGSVAALAGQLAGALHGESGIPSDWLELLAWRDRIIEMTDALFDQAAASGEASD